MAAAESRAGGPLTEYPVTLSRDANVNTGSLLQTLVGHTGPVSGAAQSAQDAQHIYSFSLDGTIRSWAWETERGDKKVAGDGAEETKQKRPGKVGRFELADAGKFVQLFEISRLDHIAAGKDWLAVSHRKKLTLHHIRSKATRQLKHVREITALAFHPLEDYLVSGEINGSISRWQSLSVTEREEPVVTNYHWHAHACRAVAFTPDGAYILSGGDESVLVIWQLETGKKTFVPRIGHGPISSICIASNSSLYAVSLQDNSVHIINAFSMKQDQVIQGVASALLPQDWRPLVGLVADPKSHYLVTNGYPGFASLQVYDILRDTHVAHFEVEPQSIAVRGTAYEMRVEQIAFSGDGNACATVDRYYTVYGSGSACALKFWSRNSSSPSGWTLNSRTDAAHKVPITALAYHPRDHMVVSAAQDRKFKVWVRVQRDKTKEANQAATPNFSWQCRSVGLYHDMQAESLAFSTDGSLLAVAYGPVVTLWDPTLNMLKHTLTQPHSQDVVRRVAFVANSPYLVGHTDYDLIVWNLLSGAVWWSYRLHATSIAVDPRSSRFAVTASAEPHRADFLLVFSADEPKPQRMTRFTGNARVKELLWVPDVAAQTSALVYRTSEHTYFVLRDRASADLPQTSLPVLPTTSLPTSLLTQLVPEVQRYAEEAVSTPALPLLAQDSHPLPGLGDVPSHSLPTVQDMFDSFFDRVLTLRHGNVTKAAIEGQTEGEAHLLPSLNAALPVVVVGKDAKKDRAGEEELADEVEAPLFNFDEMVTYIKQLHGSGAAPSTSTAMSEAVAEGNGTSKSPKKKKHEKESEVAPAPVHESKSPRKEKKEVELLEIASHAKSKREQNGVEDSELATPAKVRREKSNVGTPIAEPVQASARKTPRRKGKDEDEGMQESSQKETKEASIDEASAAKRRTRTISAASLDDESMATDDTSASTALRRSSRRAAKEDQAEEKKDSEKEKEKERGGSKSPRRPRK